MSWKVKPDPTANGTLATKVEDSYTLDKAEDFGFLVPCLRKMTGTRFSKKQIKGGGPSLLNFQIGHEPAH